jgi:ribosome maturation factor RimP
LASIEEKVENLIKKPINDLGYELYDVIYTKEGKDYFLRIYIDKDNGIDLNDCEKVNDAISDLLDEANYIKDQYFLEVSSPGIERIIRKNEQLGKNIGETIYVKLFKPLNNKKEYVGILEKYDDNFIEITDEDLIKLDRKNISIIKKFYNWQ